MYYPLSEEAVLREKCAYFCGSTKLRLEYLHVEEDIQSSGRLVDPSNV